MRSIGFEDGRRLHEFFDASGYAQEALRGELGITDIGSFQLRNFIQSRTTEPTARNTLVRWFAGGMSVPIEEAAKVIPPWVVQLCEDSELLVRRGDRLEGVVMMLPMGDLLIASDRVSKLEQDASDLVLWPNATTQQLLNGTIRKPVGAALDLGCATGIQALVASSHAASVVATDVNPRAVPFTEFNAHLNGARNIECLAGDCFEPVAGRTFDLIVCNPPFFITSSSGLLYCENPMELDLFLRRLLREAPAHLNEGGFFHVLCEWVELEGQPWRERLGEWLEGSGCDVWALNTYTLTPLEYGKKRAGQRPGGVGEADRALSEWFRYYQEKQVKSVHGGFITMRRRSGNNWTRLEEDPTVTLAGPLADLILAGFEARDVMQLADDELLAASLQVNSRVRLVQVMRQNGGKWVGDSLALNSPGVFARELGVDPAVAQFVGKLDGSRPLGELVEGLAERVDAPREAVVRETLAVVRKLLDRGFLARAQVG